MDLNEKDRQALSDGQCPDCGNPLTSDPSVDFKFCRKCDVYFEVQDNGWVIRNSGAFQEYIDRLPDFRV